MTINSSLIFTIITALAAFLGAVVSSKSRTDSLRIARLEQKLNLLLDHFGIAGDPALEGVADLVRRGRKIEAIKLYRRQNSGVDLREAKDAVDRLE